MADEFYHGRICHAHATEILNRAGQDGSYLVRDNEIDSKDYTLCVLFNSKVWKYRILVDEDGKLHLQSRQRRFDSLSDIVTYCIQSGQDEGLLYALKHPVPPETSDITEREDCEIMWSPDLDPVDMATNHLKLQYNMLDLSRFGPRFKTSLKNYTQQGFLDDCRAVRDGSVEAANFFQLIEDITEKLRRALGKLTDRLEALNCLFVGEKYKLDFKQKIQEEPGFLNVMMTNVVNICDLKAKVQDNIRTVFQTTNGNSKDEQDEAKVQERIRTVFQKTHDTSIKEQTVAKEQPVLSAKPKRPPVPPKPRPAEQKRPPSTDIYKAQPNKDKTINQTLTNEKQNASSVAYNTIADIRSNVSTREESYLVVKRQDSTYVNFDNEEPQIPYILPELDLTFTSQALPVKIQVEDEEVSPVNCIHPPQCVWRFNRSQSSGSVYVKTEPPIYDTVRNDSSDLDDSYGYAYRDLPRRRSSSLDSIYARVTSDNHYAEIRDVPHESDIRSQSNRLKDRPLVDPTEELKDETSSTMDSAEGYAEGRFKETHDTSDEEIYSNTHTGIQSSFLTRTDSHGYTKGRSPEHTHEAHRVHRMNIGEPT